MDKIAAAPDSDKNDLLTQLAAAMHDTKGFVDLINTSWEDNNSDENK